MDWEYLVGSQAASASAEKRNPSEGNNLLAAHVPDEGRGDTATYDENGHASKDDHEDEDSTLALLCETEAALGLRPMDGYGSGQ